MVVPEVLESRQVLNVEVLHHLRCVLNFDFAKCHAVTVLLRQDANLFQELVVAVYKIDVLVL